MKQKNSGKLPNKKAVALRYDQEKEATPKIIGKGSGYFAEKLIALAKEHNIPIHEDSDLAEVLCRLDLNQEIPAETYVMVAEILAFIYRTNEQYGKE